MIFIMNDYRKNRICYSNIKITLLMIHIVYVPSVLYYDVYFMCIIFNHPKNLKVQLYKLVNFSDTFKTSKNEKLTVTRIKQPAKTMELIIFEILFILRLWDPNVNFPYSISSIFFFSFGGTRLKQGQDQKKDKNSKIYFIVS